MRYVHCELLGWTDFMQVVVIEVWLESKEYSYSVLLDFAFRSSLVGYRVVGIHPLLLEIISQPSFKTRG